MALMLRRTVVVLIVELALATRALGQPVFNGDPVNPAHPTA
jgi:hypothetical protein